MKSTPPWILALYLLVSFIMVSLSAQVVADCGNSSGFISIDCGVSTAYVDKATGFWYQTDEGFTGSGTNHDLPPSVNYDNVPTIARQLGTLRSFPDGVRNCYTLKPKQEKQKKYLIRAMFAYNNYDYKNLVPIFDLYVGVNYWDTMRLAEASSFRFYEIIIQEVPTGTVQVCLVNTGQGTPFINTLELRPLNDSLYSAALSLALTVRKDTGAGYTKTFTRYKDDVYDRLWLINDGNRTVPINTRAQMKPEDSAYELPSEVLRTAATAQQPMDQFLFSNWSDDISKQYYLFLHFAEIQKLPFGHKRIINVTFYDENSLSQQLPLEYLKPVTISTNITKSFASFTVHATADSDALPILNAFEIYRVVPQRRSPTETEDVNAIMEIKHTYRVSRMANWQGDPCVPSDLVWDGLNCSSGNNIRIISLNLSSSKLAGPIATSFAGLEKLESLDLSNNELTGQLPEFLAMLPDLKFINVAGNKLTGSIPKALSTTKNLTFGRR